MDTLNLKKLQLLKEQADYAYFNSGSPIMTDEAYDGLCKELKSTLQVGCLPPTHLEKIKLPIYMGSLTKHNDTKTINNFLDKFNHINSFVVQEKLDGVSCLLTYDSSRVKLYTRGNGQIGTDITHLINYGLKLPKLCQDQSFMVRGELIISKKIFIDKYKDQFKNIRNMVSGQVTAKTPDKSIIKNLDFIGYEVIYNKTHQLPLYKQYQILNDLKFKVVYNRILEKKYIQEDTLKEYLIRRKFKSVYEIDGLVITINEKYKRNMEDNPKYSFAFKIQGETAKVEVDHVKWNLSKSGKYKPQIFIKPVELSGVTISSLTGFNAKYIVDHKISQKSILLITRSGDVIPHIIAVLDPGTNDVTLPKNSKWNSVDLYHDFQETPDEVVVKQMVHFFTSLKCLNCKDKTILKIYNAGYKTIESIVQAQVINLSSIEGIGSVLATKLCSSIKTNIKEATIHELLAALNAFGEGIGLKKIQLIDLKNPENLQIKGLSEATIKDKILPVWKEGLDRVANLKLMVGSTIQEEETNCCDYNPLDNRIFVFTGFRDTILEKQIICLGGKVTSAISKKTTDLVVASHDNVKTSSKLLKARDLGINISLKSELIFDLKKLEKETNEVVYDHYSSSPDE